MTEVTIIGSGIAALAAAIEAEAQGSHVTLINNQPGATSLSSGAWDIAPGHPHRENSLAQSVQELIDRFPNHPYALLSQNSRVSDVLGFVESSFEKVSQRLDLRLKSIPGKNNLALTPWGTLKSTHSLQKSQALGHLTEASQAKLLIIGFKGLSVLYASQAAKMLADFQKKNNLSLFSEIHSEEITLKETFPSAISFAVKLDLDNSELLSQMAELAKKYQPTHIALPAVMGIQKTDLIFSRLKELNSQAHWFEMLGLTPSIPGIRLGQALRAVTSSRPWKIIQGRVISAECSGKTIRYLHIENTLGEESSAPTSISTDRVILASGKFIGGGINKEKAFLEPVFNLPVFIPHQNDPKKMEKVDSIFVGKVTESSFFSDHSLFSAGLRVTSQLQPVGERGQLLYENLFAAGSVLAGYNPTTQGCGMGVAASTGVLAGRLAS